MPKEAYLKNSFGDANSFEKHESDYGSTMQNLFKF